MVRKVLCLIVFALLLVGCNTGPRATITSTKYVDKIQAGGVTYKFEGLDIVEIVLDFQFDQKVVSDLDPKSKDYRDKLYKQLIKGAHFYNGDEEMKQKYGYWPAEAGNNYAKEMTIYYTVPTGHSVDNLRFVFDGNVLGEGATGIDKKLKPSK